MLFDYFLLDKINRDLVRDANNSTILRSDQVWVFGPISNGVLAEILLAKKVNKAVSYFKIDKPHNILPIDMDMVEMEDEVSQFRHLLEPLEVQN